MALCLWPGLICAVAALFNLPWSGLRLIPGILALSGVLLGPPVFALQLDEEVAGAVRMKSGLILNGLCGSSNTISPTFQSQRLELRRIEQQVRTYFASKRQCEPISPDNLVIPRHEFEIHHRRTSRKPMEYRIGSHRRLPFDTAGRSRIELTLPGGQAAKIQLGITKVNSQFVTVSGLSHAFEYWVDISQIPDATLYAGDGQPSLLRSAKGFENGETQLNMAQMLLDAKKFVASAQLISDIESAFPNLTDKCQRLNSKWNDTFGQRVVDELNQLRDTGKYVAARKYARLWPDAKLAAHVRVRAKALQKQLDEDDRRVTGLRQSIAGVLAKIEDQQTRRDAVRIWNQVKDEITPNTMERFGAFELFADDTQPESRFALAMSGWLLGGDDAFDNFIETVGLFEIRYLLTIYLQSEPQQTTTRNDCVAKIRQQEGFSVDRVAAILQRLPPVESLTRVTDALQPSVTMIDSTKNSTGGLVQLPSEYSAQRKYPLLIACPPGAVSAKAILDWWGPIADRQGYLLVVPELDSVRAANYGGSAEEHRQIFEMIRRIKTGLSVDDDRVFIAGHAMGGDVAMDIASSQPALFAGVISLGGRGRRHIQWSVHNSMSLPWYIVVGELQPGYYSRIEVLLRKLFNRSVTTRQYCDVVYARYRQRGLENFTEELSMLFDWMALHQREVHPKQIDATILRSTDRDWSWLQLHEIPHRFTSMEEASAPEMRPSDVAGTKPGRLTAKLTGNFIRISSIPGDGFLRLSPDLPGIDLDLPINLRIKTSSRKVNFQPSIRDMLEDFYAHRDRARLCYMKVPLGR